MSTDTLTTVDLGPVAIDLPDLPARSVDHPAGEMWQFLGDGAALLSATIAVRPTRIPNQLGANGMLREFLWEISTSLLGFATSPLDLDVPGATNHAAALVTGTRGGVAERHVIAVANDGDAQAVLVRVAVRDDDADEALARRIAESLVIGADRSGDEDLALTEDAGPPSPWLTP